MLPIDRSLFRFIEMLNDYPLCLCVCLGQFILYTSLFRYDVQCLLINSKILSVLFDNNQLMKSRNMVLLLS